MSMIDFTGKVAIVTGAGTGLGRDYAIQLAKRGAKVVVNDLGGSSDGFGSDAAVAEKVANEIKATGGDSIPNYDSVATVEGGENIVKTAVDAYGKVDILINNAGILRGRAFPKMSEEDWETVVNVNLKGSYCVTKPAFIKMKENGYGRIVMTSSVAGTLGGYGQTNYAAAKLGIAGLTNALKLEGAKHNIKVNVLLPGALTRMTEDLMSPEVADRMKVEWVTPAVLYMCSEQCQESGAYINAQGGYFSRSAILTGPGVIFPDIPTADQIMENWDRIMNLENAKFYDDAYAPLNDFFGALIGKK